MDDGTEIKLAPMQTGPKGDETQAALDRLVEITDGDNPGWSEVRDGVYDLAVSMLKPFHTEDRATELAGDIPVAWAEALIHVATKGRLPADFTTGGAIQSGLPAGTRTD
jgi:hypothetical protein